MGKRIKKLSKRKDVHLNDKVGHAKGNKARYAKSKKEVIVPASPRLFKWNDK